MMYQRMVIVWTHGAEVSLDEYLEDAPERLLLMISQAGGRCVVVENQSPEDPEEQQNRMSEAANAALAAAGGVAYSDEDFEAASLEVQIREALKIPRLGQLTRIQQRRVRQELTALRRYQEQPQISGRDRWTCTVS
eukprot:TRINITY_DN2686_c0_g1_i2.p1 TRINITY_DN2686_c0_g1~~TRINITY_DN2686_c0_g1_i2.p1  ORF type:complete len:136 (+),score=31.41 TRINITY_DN2686_c0_g1_i2:124-531(+)